MKKYIIAVLLLFIPCVTYALTMCARDNSLVVALNGWIPGITTSYDDLDDIWRADFEYGTIIGEATCLSEAETGGGPGPVTEISENYPYKNINGEMISQDFPKGLNGKDKQGNPRIYCMCRMTHPAFSRWVFSKSIGANLNCMNYCPGYCATGAGSNNAIERQVRIHMFESIGK